MKTPKLLLISILLTFCQISFSQQSVTIIPPEFVHPCGNFSYEVIVFADPNTPMNEATLAYQLPEGIYYEPNSLDNSNITELNINNLANPIFTLPDPLIGFFTFHFSVTVDCDLTNDTTPLIDVITINFDGGTLIENSPNYNRNFPLPQISNCEGIAEIANIGSIFTRSCTVVNAGFTPIYELYLIDNFNTNVLSGTPINGMIVNNNPLTILYDSDDFMAVGNGDGILDPNESIDLSILMEVVGCGNGTSNLQYAYGCGGEICEVFETIQAEVTPESNIAEITVTELSNERTGPCTPGFLSAQITNTGEELTAGAGAAYDFKIITGMETAEADFLEISECVLQTGFTLSGNTVQVTADPIMGHIIDCQQFTSDPDGVGGLDDLDDDGFFDDLPVGESVEIFINTAWNPNCTAGGCPDDFERQFLAHIFEFTNQCSANVLDNFHRYGEYEYRINISNPGHFFTNNIEDEEVAINISIDGDLFDFADACPDGIFQMNFDLPNGLVIPADFAPTYDGVSIDWIFNTPTMMFEFPHEGGDDFNGVINFELGGDCPPIDTLAVDCPLSGTDSYNLFYEIDFICSPDCNEPFPFYCDNTPAFEIICPSGGGTNNSSTVLEGMRQSLGWTDVTYSEKQDINTPGLQLQNALPGDTVLFTTIAAFSDDVFFDTIRFTMSHLMNNPTQTPYFEFGYGEMELLDSETGAQEICPLNPPTTEVEGPYTTDNFFMEPYLHTGSCFENYDLNEGDTVLLRTYYIVQPTVPTTLISVNMKSETKGANFCAPDFSTINLIQPDMWFALQNEWEDQGCEDLYFRINYRQILTAPWPDLFPFENRSYVDWDSIIFKMPPWIDIEPGSAIFNYQERTNNTAWGPIIQHTIPVNDPEIIYTDSFNYVKFLDMPLLPADMIKQGAWSSFIFKSIPHCLQTFRMPYEVETYRVLNHYDVARREAVADTISYEYGFFARTMTMQVDNPIFPGLSQTATWDIEYCYDGRNSDFIPNNWFLIDLPNEDIIPTLLIETLDDGSTIEYPIENIDGTEDYWVQIGDLLKNTCRYFTLQANYFTCESTNLTVQSDFSCHGYPEDPLVDEYDCISNYPSVNLTLNPQAAALQINLVNAPDEGVNLCEDIPYELRIINGGLGGATAPIVTLNLPESGLYYVDGTSTLAVGQGNFITLSDPVFDAASGTYQWDLTNEILEMPGLTESPENEFRVQFSVTADCDYDPYSVFTYNVDWLNLCDDFGETPELFSLPLPLNGAPNAFNKFDIAIQGGAPSTCGVESTVNITLQYLGGGIDNVTSEVENIEIFLPEGVDYVPNSVQIFQNMNGGEPTISPSGDSTLLTWPMPIGLEIGETISFSIELDFDEELDCQTFGLRSGVATIVDIPCAATPGGFCPIQFFEEDMGHEITIERGNFNLSIADFNMTPVPPTGENAVFDFIIQNTSGNSIGEGGDFDFELWFDNGDGVFDPATDIFDHNLMINLTGLGGFSSHTITDSLFYTPDHSCNGFFIFLNSQNNNCSCEDALIFYQPELTNQATTSTICSQTNLEIGAPAINGYDYSWSPTDFLTNPNSSQTAFNYTGNDQFFSDTLLLTTTLLNGCQTVDTTYITVTELSPELTATQTIDCAGNENGVIEAIVPNDWVNYTVTWSHTSDTAQQQTNLEAGDYSLSLVDAIGCTAEAEIELIEPLPLTANLTGTNLNCFEDNSGSIQVDTSGGTSPFDLVWSEDISNGNLAVGMYYLTLTDANNCEIQDSVELTQPNELTVDVMGTDLKCFEDNSGSIQVDTSNSGGVGAYTLSWSPNIATGDNLAADTYSLILTDANDCEIQTQITIDQPTELTIDLMSTNLNCFEDNSGSIQINNTSGGVGNHILNWSPNIFNGDNLAADTYNLTVTDENNCEMQTQITIDQPTPLTVDLIGSDLKCFGDNSGSIQIDTSNSGGVGSYALNWSPNIATGNNLVADTYSLTLTDANDCEMQTQITIDQPAPLTVDLIGSDLKCFEDNSGSIQVDTSNSGGVGAYTLNWSPNIATGNNLAADTYSLILTDANDCEIQTQITIGQPTELTIDLMSTNLNCFEDNSGSIQINNTSGGVGNHILNWSPNIFNGDNLAADTYNLTVTDENNCEMQTQITIDQPTPLTVDLIGSNLKCFGDNSGSIQIDTSNSGGVGSYTFNWSEDISNGNLAAGTYYLTLTDANNCELQDLITLHEPDQIILETMGEDITCQGDDDGTIFILSPESTDYQFSLNGVNQSQPVFNNLTAGVYEVVTTHNNGCSESETLILSEPTGTFLIAPPDTVLFLGDSVYLKPFYHPNIVDIQWTPPLYIPCDTCNNNWSKPLRNIEYEIKGTTESGCEIADYVFIQVVTDVHAPNVFSPNGDGVNDFFTLFTPNGVGNIDQLLIFDRWGNQVFEKENFPPNRPPEGWDGIFRGETMNPAVFAWLAYVTLLNGEQLLIYGDVTLVR